nr:signal peptide peptidase-like 2 [Tanacetum cinerariifolium]
AQVNRVALDVEQLLFLAGGHDNAIDDDVDEQPVQLQWHKPCSWPICHLQILLLMKPDHHMIRTFYLRQDHDHYQDAVCAHDEEHTIHENVQQNQVVDSHAYYTSDGNMILYDQYVKDNAVPVVLSNVSSIPTDAYMIIYNDMYEPHVQSIPNTSRNTVVENSLTAELATYKEQVELPKPYFIELNKVAIGYKNHLRLTRAKQVQPALYNGHEIIKDNHVPAIVHNTEDTLEIAEITRRKMNDKIKDPKYVTHKVKIAPHDYSKENFLATFTPQKQLTPGQIFWSQDLIKLKFEALKEQTTVSRPIKALTVWFKHAAQSYIKVPFYGAISYLTIAVIPFCIVFAVLSTVYHETKFDWIGQDILVGTILLALGCLFVVGLVTEGDWESWESGGVDLEWREVVGRVLAGKPAHTSSQLLTANDLVPITFQVAIGKCNSKADLNVLPCLKACKIVSDILKKHPLKDALTLSTPSPFIYMQKLWHTTSRAPNEKEVIRFKIDQHEVAKMFATGVKIQKVVGLPVDLLTEDIRQTKTYQEFVEGYIQPSPVTSTQGTHRTLSAPRSPEQKIVDDAIPAEQCEQMDEVENVKADMFADTVMLSQIGTDIARITRKEPKPDKKRTREQKDYTRARNLSAKVNLG